MPNRNAQKRGSLTFCNTQDGEQNEIQYPCSEHQMRVGVSYSLSTGPLPVQEVAHMETVHHTALFFFGQA